MTTGVPNLTTYDGKGISSNAGSGNHELKYVTTLAKLALGQLHIVASALPLITPYVPNDGGPLARENGSHFPAGRGTQAWIKLPYNYLVGRGQSLGSGNAKRVINSIQERVAPITVQDYYHIAMDDLTRDDLTFNLDPMGYQLMQFKNQIANSLAVRIDEDIIAELCNNAPNFVGRTDTGISTTHFSQARTELDMVPSPMDMMYSALVHPLTEHAVRVPLMGPWVQNSSYGSGASYLEKLGNITLRNNYINRMFNVMCYKSQLVPRYNPGIYAGTPAINGAQTTANTLKIDGFTAVSNGKLNKGCLLTVGKPQGLRRVDLHTAKNPIGDAQFVVTEEIDISAGGSFDVKVRPDPVYHSIGSDRKVDGAQYNRFNQAIADNDTVTIFGDSNTEYDRAIMFHKRVMHHADCKLKPLGVDPGWDKLFTQRFGVPGSFQMSIRCLLDMDTWEDPSMRQRYDTVPAWGVTEDYLIIQILGKINNLYRAEVMH